MEFIGKDFLLLNQTARTLFHSYAEKMPIIDYHCHINPAEIAGDRRFNTITEVWLGGDHYKWRLMRAAGVDERLITGSDSSDWEKFEAFASVMPKALGNPVYEWVHLELRRYFGYDKPLGPQNAREVFDYCNEKLKDPSLSVRGLIKQSNVKLICTTDDPADTLEWHQKIAGDPTCEVKVLPAFRPDKAVNIEKPEFAGYIARLAEAAGCKIDGFQSLCGALEKRIGFFDSMGCKASDHGLDYVVYRAGDEGQADVIFKKALAGEPLTFEETEIYKTALMLFFAGQYSAHGWVMQLHFSALRNNNTKRFRQLGPDTGYDAVGSFNCAQGLSSFLDALCLKDALPKTIVYSLNPNDNLIISSIIGCFQDAGVVDKLQHGSAWWFNDHFEGMQAQIQNLADSSLLSGFVGMLTDSRSFLSYTRHEYFRRVLCNCIGGWVEQGRVPGDMELLGKMVEDISFHNTARYFGFPV